MKYALLLSLIFLSQPAWSIAGVVQIIKGAAFINEVPVKKGDQVKSRDKVRTMEGSFLKLKMSDATTIQLASSSYLIIQSYSDPTQSRNNNLSLINGKMRVLVRKIAGEREKINFKAYQISLGVRGTEFMLNAYESGGAQSVDTLLLKGRLKVSGASFENFMLEKSQYFNSQALERKGLSAVKKLGPKLINKLLEADSEFLPELRLDNGHIDLSKFFSQKLLGIIPSDVFVKGVGSAAIAAASGLAGAALIGGADSDNEKTKQTQNIEAKETAQEAPKKVAKPKNRKKVRKSLSKVKGVTSFRYKLKNEKWDIRDAVLNRKSNIKNGICFYYIYKKLPGGNEPERFRRERRCDEFEYEL